MALQSIDRDVWVPVVAVRAALAAGDYFRSRLDTKLEVKTKSSPSDLVTDVDPECERRIRATIHACFPDDEVLGEESTAPGMEASLAAAQAVADAPRLWVVDPLDGTTNFVYGMPLSAVSIAYAEHGEVQCGVVYDPYRGEVFLAQRGTGAWRLTAGEAAQWCAAETPVSLAEAAARWLRLRASTEASLAGAIVATGFPSRQAARDQTLTAGMRLTGRVKNLRALGSAALHLAYVAAGRLDAFWEYDLNAWDLAAGVCLVTEAGGHVQQIGGGTYHLAARDILVCGRPELAQALDAALRGEEDGRPGAW
ncbi:inositol-1-monophosphatase [Alicyclobacillus cellulosilyticus]|uniref:Inositol-1-monophosphatase n=1 Tax=Alicyclobacillus cellulosilyticus TaxID=1003997 RepID=A0A917NG86_9BACL|nr:inositol monophosphatase family protein [Alicyclobacillus cellulosilyticus]GGI98845.1 inositol-1-monophosphatase [Alicyclobacillus cellulosilyticus]